MGTTEKKVSARELARKKVAARQEAQRHRDQQNEHDLATVLKAGEVAPAAKAVRDKTINAAEDKYQQKVEAAYATMGIALASMRERGESVAVLAELTELGEPEVRRLLKLHTDRPEAPAPKNGGQQEAVEPELPQPQTDSDPADTDQSTEDTAVSLAS